MIIHCFTSAQLASGQKRLNRFLITCGAVLLVEALSGCRSDARLENEVVVFAAASLQEPMQEIAASFQAEHGIAVRLNFAGSGVLAKQIVSGAEADVFISASKDWVDEVSSVGAATKGAVAPFVSNALVIVAHKSTDWKIDSIEELGALPFRYLVVGDPDFVPAGKYAQQFLRSINEPGSEMSLWDSMSERVSPISDLRRILALVESDRSLVGVVYATDFLKSRRVRSIHRVPSDDISVDYFWVAMKPALNSVDGRDYGNEFRRHVFSQTSADIFRRHGFSVGGKAN